MEVKKTWRLADWQAGAGKDPVDITVTLRGNQILIDTTDGRSIAIEAEDGDLRVHGYNEIKEEPCSLRIGPDREIEVEASDYAAGGTLAP